MRAGIREKNIRQIIDMENRIIKCNRCPCLTICMRKPSFGKGDLEPQILLLFECENNFTRDTEKIIDLRNLIKKDFNTERVYHTFMVRCQPKACSSRHSTICNIDNKLLDKDYGCRLTGRVCDGIPVRPNNEEIVHCLPFFIEEMEILQTDLVILFGRRASEFVLRACGIFDPVETGNVYRYANRTILTTVEEGVFNSKESKKLVSLIYDNGQASFTY